MFGARAIASKANSSSSSVDTSFRNVTLLLNTSTTNGGANSTFLDSSASAFSLTRNGNPTQGSFSPYGPGWSTYYRLGASNHTTLSSNAALKFGAGDFTIEMWFNVESTGSPYLFTEFNQPTGVGQFALVLLSDGSLRFYYNYTSAFESRSIQSATGLYALGTWAHVAVVRSTTTLTMYVNGVSVASASVGANALYSSSGLSTKIGGATNGTEGLSGYISNLRVTTSAVYTSGFTPPTSTLTAIAGTQLLTCHKPYFVDDSTNAITFSHANVNVRKFSPFGRVTGYSAATEGGSGYFDGSGDFLSFTGNANTLLNSGDFTMEFWVYRTGSADQVIIDSGGGQVLEITIQSNHTMYFYDGSTTHTTPATPQYLLYPGMWHHVAVTVSSVNSMGIYINGKLATSATVGRGWTQSTWQIGRWWNGAGYDFAGYLSDVRIVKGSIVYTGAFTPPTAPLTAITNTTLLVRFQNANIWDAACSANFETISPAQVTTAQQKFGGSSLSTDGASAYLPTAEQRAFSLGTDFTIEAWVRWVNNGSAQNWLEARASDSTTTWVASVSSSGFPYLYDGAAIRQSSIGLSSGTWSHVAISRAAGTLRIFVDGALGYTAANTTVMLSNGPLQLGGSSFGSSFRFNGNLDEVRVTRGIGRYTSAFSVPTAAFPTT